MSWFTAVQEMTCCNVLYVPRFQKGVKKMGNCSEFHSERNYYLQNWYFNRKLKGADLPACVRACDRRSVATHSKNYQNVWRFHDYLGSSGWHLDRKKRLFLESMARFRLRNVHLRKERKKGENDEHIRKKPVSNSENCQSADSLVYDRTFFVASPFTVIFNFVNKLEGKFQNLQYS